MSSQTSSDRIFRLAAGPNNYDWGPLGKDSLVAQFAPNAAKPGYEVKDDEPYSELWMGTHPTNPSSLYPSGSLLSEHLKANPDLLGDANKFSPPFTGKGAEEKDGGHVPFLFKILCARKALPLQIHPNKELAQQLHEQDPENYPDTNHKPEIAVCLSDRFLGFANFRPIAQTQAILSTISELSSTPLKPSNGFMSDLFDMDVHGDKGTDLPENDVAKLKAAWKAFLLPEVVKSEQVQKAVSGWAARVKSVGVKVFEGAKNADLLDGRDKENIVEAVGLCEEFYPGDPATLACIIFMNLVELKKGEGMYVGADGLHAWLSGQIVELMATSDNVLNIGFTSPSEIAESLLIVSKTVSAQPTPASSIILSHSTFSKSAQGKITAYSVPFEEFSIMRVSGSDEMRALSGPAVGIVTEGEGVVVGETGQGEQEGKNGKGLTLDQGMVFFLGANTATRFDLPEGAEVWLAFYDGDKEAGSQVGQQ